MAEIQGVDGLFSSAWILIQTAAETGRLRRLTNELAELATQQVPNAESVLLLARVAAVRRKPDEQLSQAIREHAAKLRQAAGPDDQLTADGGLADMVLATACLRRSGLHALGQQMLKSMIARTDGRSSPLVRPERRPGLDPSESPAGDSD